MRLPRTRRALKSSGVIAIALLAFSVLHIPRSEAQDQPTEDASDSATFHCVVVDDQRQPIPGAQVIASISRKGAVIKGWIPTPHRGQTDNRGKFSFVFNDLDEISSVAAVAYAEGRTLRSTVIAFRETENPSATIQLSPSAKRQVRIVDDSGAPIPNATLLSIASDAAVPATSAIDWKRLGLPTPTSNAEGILDLLGVTDKQSFLIKVSHPDYAQCLFRSVDVKTKLPDLILDKGHLLTFRVTCLSDPSAVSQTRIEASISSEAGHYDITTEVDEKGHATMRLPDKHGSINALHPTLGCEDWHWNKPGKYEFWLYPYGEIQGRVINEKNGKGASRVGVSFVTGNKVIASAMSDENGDYTARVPANSAGLTVTLADWSQGWIPNDEKEFVRAKAGKTVKIRDLTVRPKAPVRGRVLNESGEPVKNAIVITGFRDFQTLTDENGDFEFVSRTTRGTLVQAFHPYKPLSQAISVEAESQEAKLFLKQDGTVIGMVMDTDRKPLAGIPVVAQGRFKMGRMSSRSIAAHTMSRDDGTFRFVGLCEGMTYQPQVRGASRASFSQVPVRSGNEAVLGAARDRRPIQVNPKLLKEVEDQLAQKPQHPPELVPFECSNWTGSKPIQVEELRGKAVLLCFGVSASPLKVCEAVHQLYGDQGLQVIYLGYGLNELGMEQAGSYESILHSAKITYATAHDKKGQTAKKYGVGGVNDFFCLLYDKHGRFCTEVRWKDIREIRNHMIYEHPKE